MLRRVTAAEGYDVLFSLLVPEPDKIRVTWDAAAAVETHIDPLVSSLANLTSLSVKTQVLYLKRLNVKPRKAKGGEGHHRVGKKELGLAINPVESQLASHVSSLPRLNFLAYVSPVEHSPLYVADTDKEAGKGSNAFLIPRYNELVFYLNSGLTSVYKFQMGRCVRVQPL